MLEPVNSILVDPHSRILDLCSGPGAFITEILRRRLVALGACSFDNAVQALCHLFAFDILEDNVESCRGSLRGIMEGHFQAQGEPLTEVELELVEKIIEENVCQVDVLSDGHSILLPRRHGIELVEFSPIRPRDFDYIVSNPPYQKNISGSTEQKRLRNHSKSTPIYQYFYDYARWLDPISMSFIIPAKWYTGGWGLDKWRASVLDDGKISLLYDYRDSSTVFPGVQVNGGICWMLRERDHQGLTRVVQFNLDGTQFSDTRRPLVLEGADFFVRDPNAASILDKVGSFTMAEDERFSSRILPTTPFGIASNFTDYQEESTKSHDIGLYYIKKKTHWIARHQVTSNSQWIDSWKVFLSLSYNQHSPQIINEPAIFGPGFVCSHSYICVIGFDSQAEAEHAVRYMKTRFFRYLAHQLKISPIATRGVYRLIPVQSWTEEWTDEKLYDQYSLSTEEIEHIEKTITPMCPTPAIS